MKIHIFNIDSDYSLADFSPLYTPPKRIVDLRREMALTPLRWAGPADKVLLLDAAAGEPLPHPSAVSLDGLPRILAAHPDAVFEPWGWAPSLKQTLLRAGMPEAMLPSDRRLEEIRRLSHRRTTIPFNSALDGALTAHGFDSRHLSGVPLEFFNVEEAMDWAERNRPAFFKAPWSSSGRGILFTDTVTTKQTEEWLRGIIRRQGSVMAERPFPKRLDCATEWRVTDSGAEFMGVSVFEASRRGKYHFNLEDNQEALMERIRAAAPDFGPEYIECQREALEKVIGGARCPNAAYRGFVGIDMVISPDGAIHGGIELNFRRTMGMASLTDDSRPTVVVLGSGNVGTHLHEAFKRAGISAVLIPAREYGGAELEADSVIICVRDSDIKALASRLRPAPGTIVAHTSGSIGIDALQGLLKTGFPVGVFYPLQTFSRDVGMDYSDIPFLIEGSDRNAVERLVSLAKRVSGNVMEADSRVRSEYHIAAVVACNFANHLWSLADGYLASRGLPFSMLHPLLRQTLDKALTVSPREAQTGPARRGDRNVLDSHMRRLSGSGAPLAEIYGLLSESILREYEDAKSGADGREDDDPTGEADGRKLKSES